MTLHHLDDCEPGPVPLTPHRFVHWTGKVAIGLRHEPRYVEQGSHALMWQRALTTDMPPEPTWHRAPRPIATVAPMWLRLLRLIHFLPRERQCH